MSKILIAPEEKRKILSALRTFYPDAKIYVFGSRVDGSAKKYSDLDLAVDDGKALDFVKLASLKEIYAESQLPYKVDISDFQSMDSDFQKLVRDGAIVW